MPLSSNKLVILSALAAGIVVADEPFSFCTEGQCGDCPVTVASAGTGFPECVIYNSHDFFSGGDFPTLESDGFEPFLNVVQPDPNCKTIVKSPASTSVEGCGYIIGSFGHETCASLPLKKSFMVQTCCGDDDCKSAGTPWKRSTSSGSLSGGLYLKDGNGTIIEPAERGQPKAQDEKRRSLTKRASCEKNSWVADEGQESYTRPADGGQVVYTGLTPGEPVTITETRTTSWSQSLGADVGFADVLSLGLSMESTMEKSTSDSTAKEFSTKEGQTGDVVFTPFLRCSTGTATCNGGELHGEVCTGYKDSTSKIAGQYSVAVTS